MRVPHQITSRTRRTEQGPGFIRGTSGADTASAQRLAQAGGQFANALGSVGGLLTKQAAQAQRLGVLQSFSAFQTAVDEEIFELKRNADPRQGNFADQVAAIYNNREQEWLANVPDQFHDEFKTRTTDVKGRVLRDALAFQYERTDEYFRTSVIDAVNRAAVSLDQDGGIENLERQRAIVDDFINSTGLTEAEKVAMRRNAYATLEGISYKTEVRRGNIELGALGVGGSAGQAVDLIAEFDGPNLENNGLTYEENREALQAIAQEAEQRAVAAIGSLDVWTAMPARARAAITSLVADLGELPESVRQVISTGNLEEVANAIKELGPGRREVEAEVLLGTEEMPEGLLDADPRYANIPYEDRLALRADAEREAAAQLSADAAAEKAARDSAINNLMVKLYDGDAGQYEIDQAREAGILTDFEDIKRAQGIIDDQTETLRAVQAAQERLSLGLTFDPLNTDHKEQLNALFAASGGVEGLQNLDQNTVANVLVPLVRQSKDIPEDAYGLLTGMMRSDNPQRALFALDALSQLQQASPQAYDHRITEAVAADVEYWRTVKDYYPMEEVLASVRGATTQELRVREQTLRQQAKEMLNTGDVTIDFAKAFDTNGWLWGGEPLLNANNAVGIQRDFNTLFEREFARDGNAEAAKKRTVTALGRVWNVTNVGGQAQLMKYPPQLAGYTPWNQSYDWMTQQGRAELGLDESANFQLISDEQTRTEMEQGAAPSYLAVYADENGNLVMPRNEDGSVKRLFFEITPEMEIEKITQLENAKQEAEFEDFLNTYTQAQRHSVETGVPIPEDLEEDRQRWLEIMGEDNAVP